MAEYPQIPGIEFAGVLGRGAHSVVYRGAQDGVACAVKLPRAKARWSRWIYREAVSLARVRHPLLPAVLEVGDIDGLPYLVMELVEGVTLADKLGGQSLDEDAVVALARQLASVLSAVHDAGLVHRDVKPRNIVIESTTGALKLVDFGFATPMERVGAGDTAGTADYSAPEQLAPPGRVDARSDLYAVGRVLFECLCGRSLLTRVDGPWGVAARTELIGAGVSPGLAEIVAGLLRRAPEERYSGGRALGADLERLASGDPVLGPRVARPDDATIKLVARDAELERAIAPCRDLRARGGALVRLEAARGGGKTRFMELLTASTRNVAATVKVACCQDDQPLATLRRILDGFWELCIGRHPSSVDDVRAAIGNLLPVVQLIAPRSMVIALSSPAPEGAPQLGGSHALAPESLVEGAAEVLLRLAARLGPLVIAVDDAHWMDPGSKNALLGVAHRIADAPLALVLASRPMATEGGVDPFAAVRPGRSFEIVLPLLSERSTGDLVAAHLGLAAAEPALVARVHAMAGGTPLGVLEVLGAYLDAGVLRPHARSWAFDSSRTDQVVLPHGALALLGRRLGELPPATRRVLESAAVVGTSFADATLARVVDVSEGNLAYAMASARRAGLVEVEQEGRHRFVHDSLREMLVRDIAEGERRATHQRIAEVLDSGPSPTFAELCAAAAHFAEGEPGREPARVHRVARAAAEAALERFDNETALRFFDQAQTSATAAAIRLDAAFFISVGEAKLRLGAIDGSLEAFESALERSTSAIGKAFAYGRISWVHQTRAEPERAWATLGRAFATMGVRMPVEDVGSAATTSARLARARIGRLLARPSRATREEIDLVCALHYQNARLGLEYGKPMRLIQSSLESLELSERGGSDAMRTRARAYYALVVTALGRHEGGAREIALAKSSALRDADPSTVAFCLQIEAVAAGWAGDLDRSLSLFRECVDVHGPWLETNEYCQDVTTGDIIESLRGRSDAAWPWIERALERLRRTRSRPVVAEYIVHRARAALAAIEREVTNDPWLMAQLAEVSLQSAGQGLHRLLSWGPRARFYFERGDFGPEFEALVLAFRGEGHNPRTLHLTASEYYVAVAHTRIHQTLRAPLAERARTLPALRIAAADLRAAAKIPLLRAHALLAEASLAVAEDKERAGKKLLAAAEAIASQQSCPWVLYGVARARAHMLRASGKNDAALDQARAAELFAREHGAAMRARWIREEFGLADAATEHSPRTISSRRSSSRANRQLTALLQVARAPRRDLKTEQQASVILDELMKALGAHRATIWFQPEMGVAAAAVSRHRGGDVSVTFGAATAHGELLREIERTGTPWPTEAEVGGQSESEHAFDPKRFFGVPLFLYEKPVGAICIERAVSDLPFTRDDRSLLELLSHQVPVTLEIARLLFEREQLHSSLQRAKKMEAMGQLAGGLAHDFNNMLAAMQVALGNARERAALDTELTVELDIISQATTRAAQLTSQLLSFSRHQPVPVAVHDVNELIATLEPMLRRVVGQNVSVLTKLSPAVDAVEIDQGSFDQALVNLLINARDAMPNGGVLTVSTKNVDLSETAAEHLSVPPGHYVELAVSDSGEGMSPETMARIFEPFFTTKPLGVGSGLGLAMVYAFARNCGGGIDVSSELGKGTEFRIYLKKVDRPRLARLARAAHAVARAPVVSLEGADTILVVDDDELVRRSIAKILERNGYRVLAAGGSNEALDVVREHGARIGLVILDVLMPGVTGPELGRRLYAMNVAAKLLFVSGFSPESIPVEEGEIAAEMLLQKPFTQSTLLERVRQLMHH